MKQLYILALAGLISFGAAAQKVCAPAEFQKVGLSETKSATPTANPDRVTIWQNSIDDCSEWAAGNANETGANAIWQCGPNLEPTGDYAIAGINSATADDGLLLLDSDAAGTAVGPLENSWVDLTTSFTTVGHPRIALSFFNYFRTYQSASEYCLLEVSRDGMTWPDVATSEEADGFVTYNDAEGPVQARWDLFQNLGQGEATNNPEQVVVNISDVAGDQAEVYLRFRWVGSWGYAWMVDDLEVIEIPGYDVSTAGYVSYTNEANTNLYEYGAWPESQLPDTLTFACEVLNFGDSLATGVYGQLDYNGYLADGSTLDTLESGSVDTVYVNYPTTGGFGPLDLSLSLMMDSTDENEANNSVARSFEVTEYQWGRDDGVYRGLNTGDGTLDYIEMPLYQVLEDQTIYGVDVAIWEGSEPFTPVRGFLVDMDDETALIDQYGGEVASSPEVALVESNFNSTEGDIVWYTFAFDDPYDAVAGQLLGAAFEHYGGANVVIGRGQTVPAQTVFIYGPYGEGQAYDWYYQGSTPMVRLNLNPDAVTTTADLTIGEGFEMFPAFPNPTTDNTRFQFRLDQAAAVTFELRDITGKLVEVRELGTQPVGMNNFMVETSAFGAGSYTATLVVNGARITQKLMVK